MSSLVKIQLSLLMLLELVMTSDQQLSEEISEEGDSDKCYEFVKAPTEFGNVDVVNDDELSPISCFLTS